MKHTIKHGVLERFEGDDKYSAGHLTVDAQIWFTVELGWQDNKNNVSCVAPGDYICMLYHSPRHGRAVFQLQDVDSRTFIEIHIANKPSELLGCIAVGKEFGQLDGEHAVLDSAIAFKEFMDYMGNNAFVLSIVDNIPNRFQS